MNKSLVIGLLVAFCAASALSAAVEVEKPVEPVAVVESDDKKTKVEPAAVVPQPEKLPADGAGQVEEDPADDKKKVQPAKRPVNNKQNGQKRPQRPINQRTTKKPARPIRKGPPANNNRQKPNRQPIAGTGTGTGTGTGIRAGAGNKNRKPIPNHQRKPAVNTKPKGESPKAEKTAPETVETAAAAGSKVEPEQQKS